MKRYSIIVENMENCVECGQRGVELHEVFFGNSNRKNSIEYGLVIPLCSYHHRNSPNGIHFNKELNYKYRKIAQKKFEETYDKEFIKIFGRNYL